MMYERGRDGKWRSVLSLSDLAAGLVVVGIIGALIYNNVIRICCYSDGYGEYN
jgi:hypothetical protein